MMNDHRDELEGRVARITSHMREVGELSLEESAGVLRELSVALGAALTAGEALIGIGGSPKT